MSANQNTNSSGTNPGGSSRVSGDGLSYRDAGVDTHGGQDFVRAIRDSVASTHIPGVLTNTAGFGGLFDLSFLKAYRQPMLVTSTDGVGTKLRLAQLFDRHDTVGIDLVAMCVNDLLATGARPLQFLDYIACGRLDQARMSAIVSGIAAGCRTAGCVLAGGETAEHPDTMQPEDYDLAGFVVGVAEQDRIIDGQRIAAGDAIVSLPSSGIHSNGLSLVRRIFLRDGMHLPEERADCEFLFNKILLRPTVIYEPILRPIFNDSHKFDIRGIANITGGGFYENIPRILKSEHAARIERSRLVVPELFARISERGPVSEREMFSVFNMGTGMVIVLPADQAAMFCETVNPLLRDHPVLLNDDPVPEARVIGRIVPRSNEAVEIV
ncbi:MAG: phosphoribosylformylglycinamidine cyclo-ligase [Leptospiraceae bacterium]|nr:phosphoribosylformylglycinamidine cyclo-ligase [Leptospiraceae bacterium]